MAFRGLTTLRNILNKSTVQVNAFNKPQVRNYILSTRALRNVKAEQDGKPTPEFQSLLRRTGQNLRKIGGEPAPYKKKVNNFLSEYFPIYLLIILNILFVYYFYFSIVSMLLLKEKLLLTKEIVLNLRLRSVLSLISLNTRNNLISDKHSPLIRLHQF